MFYERRPIRIHDRPDNEPPTTLALALSSEGYTHTLCTAFRLSADVVIANDATSEDGAGEWAVLRAEPGGTWRQIDSITFGWMRPSAALNALKRVRDIPADYDQPIATGVRLREHPEGTCPCCA